MALKKSELYSLLWSSCDELRGGMDASQYKDYVLSFLFIKYISDKYAGQPFAPITVPEGASFADMVALKGRPDIGDQINKKIIAPLAGANQQLSQADFPDFNDPVKLGDGKEKVDRLTNLIAIFENPALNFSKNRADGDDILGDAYEYLMRHFATESGKSKGQFYTPAEVSRVIAQVIGIRHAVTTTDTTVYDPACGSGSLLLKVADEAQTSVTLYGQEKDAATSGLARMNMILHNTPTALIMQGNSLTDPKFRDGDSLKTFDYVVANPPFSDKRWGTGLDPLNDPYDRFRAFGVPPAKQGDYAYLLHIIRSLKSTGKGACILPHGVLFRGNAEADIRRNLVRKGYIKGVIGLPPNLFYGTGIPACIVVVDKQNAHTRKGVFMIDASQGYMKDGPKNRLRSRDIHMIVDAFTKGIEIPGYSRMVPFAEIEKNEFNLNLPRYIDSQKAEDRQDIEGHLRGGIPQADIDALQSYWEVCPSLKKALFKKCRPEYVELAIDKAAIKTTIFEHPEFLAFTNAMNAHFDAWRKRSAQTLKALEVGHHPKEVIFSLSEGLLTHYVGTQLIDRYAVYQHLMDYWADVMQDDCFLISADGWKAQTYRIIETNKKGKERDKGWACDLISKELIVAHYFAKEQAAIDVLTAELEAVSARLAELEEEHGSDEGAFAEVGKINKDYVTARLREIKGDTGAADESAVLKEWLKLHKEEAVLKRQVKEAEAALDLAAYQQYPKLSNAEIKALVVDGKWLAKLEADIHGEIDRIGQQLTQRAHVLAERYESPMRELAKRAANLETTAAAYFDRMGLLSGEKRLPGFNAEWEIRPLGELASFLKGKGLPKSALDQFGSQECIHYGELFTIYPETIYEVISRTSISGDWVRSVSNDVLMPTSDVTPRGLAKGSCIMKSGVIIGSDILIVRPDPDKLFGPFLSHVIRYQEEQILQLVSGTTVFHIYASDMMKFRFPVPSLHEQKAIIDVLENLDRATIALELKLAKVRQVKSAMAHGLLSGRVRLP